MLYSFTEQRPMIITYSRGVVQKKDLMYNTCMRPAAAEEKPAGKPRAGKDLITMTTNYKAVIFDMDGTILDTVEELTDALNHTRAQLGFPADLTPQKTMSFFSNGAKYAVSCALADAQGLPVSEVSEDLLEKALTFFKQYYGEHSGFRSRVYPGITELLQKLAGAGIKTAVVSNKPDPTVQKLCRVYFPDLFTFALGETARMRRKPWPDMVLYALEQMGLSADEAVYVGDSEVDIKTAAGAGLPCICVEWGFRTKEQLMDSGAETIVSNTDALTKEIFGHC